MNNDNKINNVNIMFNFTKKQIFIAIFLWKVIYFNKVLIIYSILRLFNGLVSVAFITLYEITDIAINNPLKLPKTNIARLISILYAKLSNQSLRK